MVDFNKKISIVGMGYIGLPIATLLASKGVSVFGYDINEKLIESVKSGAPHISEPGLEDLLSQVIERGKLQVSNQIYASDVYVIAVPTPYDKEKNEADLSYVFNAVGTISEVLKAGDLIMIESTCPPGTTTKICEKLSILRADLNFPTKNTLSNDVSIAFCPERILPGNMITELVKNDRIIGGMTPECSKRALEVYKVFVEGNLHIAENALAAEVAKLSENAFRDVNIAFANELSILCENFGLDAFQLIKLTNCHPRVNILEPGPGVGGHCIAVDPLFLIQHDKENTKVITAAREVNERKKHWVIDKIRRAINTRTYSNVVLCGLTYKANVDDIRESPSLDIYRELKSEFGEIVKACDPYLEKNKLFCDELVNFEENEGADLMVLLVEHDEFLHGPKPSCDILDFRGKW